MKDSAKYRNETIYLDNKELFYKKLKYNQDIRFHRLSYGKDYNNEEI